MKTRPATPEFIAWFKKQLNELLPMAREIIGKGHDHVPAMFVFPADPKVTVAVIPLGLFFEGPPGKDIVHDLHRNVAEGDEVKAVIVISETWMVSVPRDEPNKSLHDHPDRREGLMYNAIEKGMQLIAMYEISRPANTLPDTPTMLLDPLQGSIEGEGAGFVASGMVGRMILEDEDQTKH